jgi:FkbM family methyltransferase
VSILEFAISNSNSYVKLNISGERTSSYIPIESDFIQVKSKSSADFVNEIERDIDFLEINIEGAEYEVLEELINTGCITRIVIVNIQFHKINENSELERQVLRNRLNLTHQLEFNYDWVWERWVRR